MSDETEDIKAVYKPDAGYTDTYFGGEGAPDGPGHGHIRANEEGDLSVVRRSYTPGVPNARRAATEVQSTGCFFHRLPGGCPLCGGRH